MYCPQRMLRVFYDSKRESSVIKKVMDAGRIARIKKQKEQENDFLLCVFLSCNFDIQFLV